MLLLLLLLLPWVSAGCRCAAAVPAAGPGGDAHLVACLPSCPPPPWLRYIGEMGKDYIYAVTPLLEDALMDRDLVHRQVRGGLSLFIESTAVQL